MNQKPRKNCIICEREIFRGRNQNKEKRGDNFATCSSRCSKTYMRVINYVSRRIRRKLKEKYKIK
jgi:hypothetical protein